MVEHDGVRLETLLSRAKRTQAELAEATGVSPTAVGKWIRSGKIGRQNIAAICRFLQCSSDELLGLAPVAPAASSEGAVPIFTRERRASDDIEALQIALESLTVALLRSAPDAAKGFRADLEEIASRQNFSSQHGLLGALDDIAHGVQREREAEVRARRRDDSA